MASPSPSVLNVNVGVLGHVDSGKTSLCKALSSQGSTAAFDKHPDSQQRGMTLDLGFSVFFLPLCNDKEDSQKISEEKDDEVVKNKKLLLRSIGIEKLQFTLVDCPGHASLIRTIIGGAQIIDIMILVLDASKGIQTQTAECIVIGEVLGKTLLVVLNKCDLILGETIEQKRNELEKVKKKLRQVFETSTRWPTVEFVEVSAAPGGKVESGEVSTRPPIGLDQIGKALLPLIDIRQVVANSTALSAAATKLLSSSSSSGGVENSANISSSTSASSGGGVDSKLLNNMWAHILADSDSGEEANAEHHVGANFRNPSIVVNRPQNHQQYFFMFIDHCFPIKGQGTVLTGTVLDGSVKVGEDVYLPDFQVTRRVKGIQVFRKPVPSATRGDRIGMCITQFDAADMERGMACHPKAPVMNVACCIAQVQKVRFHKLPIEAGVKLHVTLGHTTVMGTLRFFCKKVPLSANITGGRRRRRQQQEWGTRRMCFNFADEYDILEDLPDESSPVYGALHASAMTGEAAPQIIVPALASGHTHNDKFSETTKTESIPNEKKQRDVKEDDDDEKQTSGEETKKNNSTMEKNESATSAASHTSTTGHFYHEYYAIILLDHPVTTLLGSTFIASRLDTDIHVHQCRLAVQGVLLASLPTLAHPGNGGAAFVMTSGRGSADGGAKILNTGKAAGSPSNSITIQKAISLMPSYDPNEEAWRQLPVMKRKTKILQIENFMDNCTCIAKNVVGEREGSQAVKFVGLRVYLWKEPEEDDDDDDDDEADDKVRKETYSTEANSQIIMEQEEKVAADKGDLMPTVKHVDPSMANPQEEGEIDERKNEENNMEPAEKKKKRVIKKIVQVVVTKKKVKRSDEKQETQEDAEGNDQKEEGEGKSATKTKNTSSSSSSTTKVFITKRIISRKVVTMGDTDKGEAASGSTTVSEVDPQKERKQKESTSNTTEKNILLENANAQQRPQKDDAAEGNNSLKEELVSKSKEEKEKEEGGSVAENAKDQKTPREREKIHGTIISTFGSEGMVKIRFEEPVFAELFQFLSQPPKQGKKERGKEVGDCTSSQKQLVSVEGGKSSIPSTTTTGRDVVNVKSQRSTKKQQLEEAEKRQAAELAEKKRKREERAKELFPIYLEFKKFPFASLSGGGHHRGGGLHQ